MKLSSFIHNKIKMPRKLTSLTKAQGDPSQGGASVHGDPSQGSASVHGDPSQDALAALQAARKNATTQPNQIKEPKTREAKEPGALARLVNSWWNRLITAVYSGSLSNQTAQYTAHNTTRDYIFNSIGAGIWGVLFPFLTIVATQLTGAEHAGMFTMAFVVANLLQFVGMYGVRTFQVSDIDEMDSFAAYQIQRVIACVLMLGLGWLYCTFRGYSDLMLTICAGCFTFRMIDSLADVYEGRLQQFDKLYLAGISQALRCILALVGFTVMLFITRNLGAASVVMAVAAGLSLVIVTIPLTLFETPRSRHPTLIEVREIFVECWPAFLAQFLFALIETMPKFVMEGALAYQAQVYFNAIYFPAQGILMVIGLMYKPQLVRLANIWSDPSKRKRFDLIIIAVLVVCAVYTAIVLVITAWIGIPILSFMYGLDFEPYRQAQYLMIGAGGLSAAIDFLYQIITVLRQQSKATSAYGIAFVFVSVASFALIQLIGFDGAVWAYVSVMVVLLVLLAVQYLRIHRSAAVA